MCQTSADAIARRRSDRVGPLLVRCSSFAFLDVVRVARTVGALHPTGINLQAARRRVDGKCARTRCKMDLASALASHLGGPAIAKAASMLLIISFPAAVLSSSGTIPARIASS